ncbi:MAG: M13 family peptidase, partial [Ferruginibacter sp.]|nr:M13 family peptidase [Ferruginibacter sp.]
MKKGIIIITACISFCACKTQSAKNVQLDILTSNIDSSIKPGDDFFMYANGGWIKHTPIPGAESGWGNGNLVMEENYTRLKKINEDAIAAKGANGTVTQKIGDFWQSAMDTVAINKAGLLPLQNSMDLISSIKTTNDLLVVGAAFQTKGINCFFNKYVAQDDKN